MTYSTFILFVLCLAAYNIQDKVDLKKDRIKRISFDELVIFVDNSAGKTGGLQICLVSSPDEAYQSCPYGFTGPTVQIQANEKVLLTVHRRSQLPDSILRTWEDGEFIEDLYITVTESHYVRCATLNAAIEKETSVKKESKSTTIRIVVGVVGLILFIMGIGATVGICLYRRNKNKKPTTPLEIVVQKPNVTEHSTRSPVTKLKPQATPKQKTNTPQTPIQPSPTSNAVPASEPKPTTQHAGVTPASIAQVGSQPKPSSTKPIRQPQKNVKDAKSKRKAETPKATPSAESTEPTKDASVDQSRKRNSKHDSKKSLKVEKTQTETLPSPPTPKFTNHSFSKSVADNSTLKEKNSLLHKKKTSRLGRQLDEQVLLAAASSETGFVYDRGPRRQKCQNSGVILGHALCCDLGHKDVEVIPRRNRHGVNRVLKLEFCD